MESNIIERLFASFSELEQAINSSEKAYKAGNSGKTDDIIRIGNIISKTIITIKIIWRLVMNRAI